MKTAKEYLESEVKRLVEAARAITRTAEEENRGLSDEERMKVEGLISETNTLKSRIAEQEDNERLLAAIEHVGSNVMGEPTKVDAPAKSVGEAFVRSDGYRGLKARGMNGNWTTGPVEFGAKLDDGGSPALTVTAEGTTGPFGTTGQVQTQVLPGVQAPVEQSLTIADLLGQGVATSNVIVYLKESVTTNSAATVAEGGAKPASVIDFTKASAAVEKIATFLPISDEMLEDEPQIASYINSRLALFVRQAEESYLLTAILAVAGSASNATEVGGTNMFDGIAAAIMHVREDAGLEPDALVCSPLDAAQMDVLKASGSGVYYSGGPYGSPAQNPWGLRRVVTTAVADGSPIVGAFREGATLWRKGGLTVEASNSHADYFRKNLTALRAEERLALTIFRDAAFQVAAAS